ncbi:16S rRNA (cytidine(1402)-2'-O)-methyltransferase [Roseicitreum antarcticum]|uniref:Ribosomal RNA small subunit methyltransferase I n=1 Tax=Roseicitreum antarcticum TaxID=564137 RepID=A0A1H2SK73_9RHOB|nr:16S rRNA (cytidine(1402)-2'-O)-methyltransferase [Roseicitreum antarcticum]SDW31449.1 16S rRNA (cytidine1402-2'-O)-methyltransferase [Roseicitreum antarcticum]
MSLIPESGDTEDVGGGGGARRSGPPPPGLYFIATPIGAARDITLRALDLLRDGDVLVAEDTRSLRRLMEIHGVPLAGRRVLAYHDHNGSRARPALLAALAEGKTVVYASEAGTPLVADPGYQLSRSAIEAGHPVFAAPGPSAVLAALTVAGLPSDRFCFLGFAPPQMAARRAFLSEARSIPATLVFYESPKRIHKLLNEMVSVLGAERGAAVCRELTKRYEEVVRGSLAELSAHFAQHEVKGELVVLVDRGQRDVVSDHDLEAALKSALAGASLREAAAQVAQDLGLPRRQVYQAALAMEVKE